MPFEGVPLFRGPRAARQGDRIGRYKGIESGGYIRSPRLTSTRLQMARKSNPSTDEFGITDADIEQIEAYLGKRQYERSVDDLRPEADD